jgi:oxysterol-binding protein 1
LDSLRQQGDLFTVGAEVSVLANQNSNKNIGATATNERSSSPVRLPPARMEVHMQVGSVRESNADGRKLYIYSGTTTLTLRAETQDDRWVWAEALRAAKGAWDGLSPAAAGALRRTPTMNSATTTTPAAMAVHNEQHSKKILEVETTLLSLGASSEAVEYVSGVLEQYNLQYTQLAAAEEIKRQALLDVVYRLENEKRQLETALVVEGQQSGNNGGGGGGGARGSARRSGGSSSADIDIDQQSVSNNGEADGSGERGGGGVDEDGNDSEVEDEFFECEALSMHSRSSSLTDLAGLEAAGESSLTSIHSQENGSHIVSTPSATVQILPAPPTSAAQDLVVADLKQQPEWLTREGPPPPRRDRLPPPQQREKSVSLWSLIKEMVGKDLTRVCLPVYFNEPLSALEKTAEEMEYSELLDAAARYPPRSVERMLRVVAFAISAYSSTVGRTAKPFNPLLGETYELVHVEKGFRFIAEKVSHHPTIIAAAAEGRGWRLEADADVKSRFWGRSIELKPEGVLKLTFTDENDVYAWNKVTTSINNLILGKIYVDHGGIMRIRNLSPNGLTARVRFKETSMLFDKDPRQVRAYFERNCDGRKLERPLVYGHWDDGVHAELENGRTIELWRKGPPPPDPTRYNLTAFSIQLNELTPGLREKLAPTDCRLRPDQAFTERGMWDEANSEKQRLEHKQRAARRAAELGEPLRPRWFDVLPAASAGKERNPNELAFAYKGGYWEARDKGDWVGCRDIFGPMNVEQE